VLCGYIFYLRVHPSKIYKASNISLFIFLKFMYLVTYAYPLSMCKDFLTYLYPFCMCMTYAYMETWMDMMERLGMWSNYFWKCRVKWIKTCLDASLWPSKFTTNSENEVCFQNGYVLASLIVLAYNSCILKLQQTLTLQGIILVK